MANYSVNGPSVPSQALRPQLAEAPPVVTQPWLAVSRDPGPVFRSAHSRLGGFSGQWRPPLTDKRIPATGTNGVRIQQAYSFPTGTPVGPRVEHGATPILFFSNPGTSFATAPDLGLHAGVPITLQSSFSTDLGAPLVQDSVTDPGQTLGTALDIGTVPAGGLQLSGFSITSSDQDWYKFTLPSTGNYFGYLDQITPGQNVTCSILDESGYQRFALSNGDTYYNPKIRDITNTTSGATFSMYNGTGPASCRLNLYPLNEGHYYKVAFNQQKIYTCSVASSVPVLVTFNVPNSNPWRFGYGSTATTFGDFGYSFEEIYFIVYRLGGTPGSYVMTIS